MTIIFSSAFQSSILVRLRKTIIPHSQFLAPFTLQRLPQWRFSRDFISTTDRISGYLSFLSFNEENWSLRGASSFWQITAEILAQRESNGVFDTDILDEAFDQGLAGGA